MPAVTRSIDRNAVNGGDVHRKAGFSIQVEDNVYSNQRFLHPALDAANDSTTEAGA